ncbi:MAG: hypothetical protein EZS28_046489, partial [Streblomastix strix]
MYVDLSFNAPNNEGGGIFAQLQESGGTLTITNQTSFVQCINTENEGGGMVIFSNGSNSRCIISDNVIFEKCKAIWGGAICNIQRDGASVEVHDITFEKCEAIGGGAIIIAQYEGTSFEVHDVIFEKCDAYQQDGGAIYIIQNGRVSFDVHNVLFKECEAIQFGGTIFIFSVPYWGDMGPGTTTISESTFSGSKSVNRGGAIYTVLYDDAALTIDNTQFNFCYSSDSDGGSIFALIYEGSLSLNQVIFTDCNCTQPGSGGAIAIGQLQSNCRISIIESSFTNCKTLPGSYSQYGWGGAIYIQMGFEVSDLSSTNFLLTDLSFTNCAAFENIGNNLHILSPNTYNTGIAIAANSLLTVKDQSKPPKLIPDLYTNDKYSKDYM